MKVLAVISLAGTMLASAASGQQANIWRNQWQTAKYGHTLTNANAVQSADRAAMTSRPAIRLHNRTLEQPIASPIPWREQWFKAKFGRYSAQWESLQRANEVTAPVREDIAPTVLNKTSSAPSRFAWRDQLLKEKYGR